MRSLILAGVPQFSIRYAATIVSFSNSQSINRFFSCEGLSVPRWGIFDSTWKITDISRCSCVTHERGSRHFHDLSAICLPHQMSLVRSIRSPMNHGVPGRVVSPTSRRHGDRQLLFLEMTTDPFGAKRRTACGRFHSTRCREYQAINIWTAVSDASQFDRVDSRS